MSASKNKEAVSPKKIESNRRNAQRSTGPKTPEGKKVSRWNALRHGLLAKELVIPNGSGMENEEEFRELLSGLMEDLQPEGSMEEILVEEIAVSYWRLRRVIRSENGRIRQEFESDERMGPLMESLLGSEPKSAAERARHARLALPRGRDAEQIFRYGAAIERTLFRALQHLERLQRRRAGLPTQSRQDGTRVPRAASGGQPAAPSGEWRAASSEQPKGKTEETNEPCNEERQAIPRKPPGRVGGENAAKEFSGSNRGLPFPAETPGPDSSAPNPASLCGNLCRSGQFSSHRQPTIREWQVVSGKRREAKRENEGFTCRSALVYETNPVVALESTPV